MVQPIDWINLQMCQTSNIFGVTGFVGAMVSNIAFVFRNIFSKKGMSSGKNVGGMNYYACLSMMSLGLLTPFAIAVEGPKAWAAGWDVAKATVGPQIFWYSLLTPYSCTRILILIL